MDGAAAIPSAWFDQFKTQGISSGLGAFLKIASIGL
jgi:hypothetical protein